MTPGRPVPSARHYAVLTLAFSAFVVYGSLVPFHVRALPLGRAWEQYVEAMSGPVALHSRSDWAANVLLFFPLGFLTAGTLTVDRGRGLVVLVLIPAMTAFSAALEFAQLWFPGRYVSINDVVAETIGGALGVGAWLLWGQSITDRLRAATAELGAGARTAKVLAAYLLLLVIVHGMPFDLTLSPWQILQKYKHGRQPGAAASGIPRVALLPAPEEFAEKTAFNVLYFVPVGVLLSRFPGGRWRGPRAAGRVLGFGLGVALALESLQLIVLSRDTFASDVPSGAVLVLVGWGVGLGFPPTNRGGDA